MIRAIAAILLLGCAGTAPVPAPLPTDQQMFWYNGSTRPPSTMHVYIYEMMQECLGIRGRSFEDLTWISADFVVRADYQRLGGLFFGGQNLIVLDLQRFNDPATVSEETHGGYALWQMIRCDVLIMSRSTFSFLAGFLHQGSRCFTAEKWDIYYDYVGNKTMGKWQILHIPHFKHVKIKIKF